jgi:uncharacterized RDD family membrane protein YckC
MFYIYTFGEQTGAISWAVHGISDLPLLIFWIAYFIGLEALNQGTPGHNIVHLKVIKADGHRITFYDALKRRLLDFIDIGVFGLPALICIYKTSRHQRLGDLFANTLVVRNADITEKEDFFNNDQSRELHASRIPRQEYADGSYLR